jgi:hypothetical protein
MSENSFYSLRVYLGVPDAYTDGEEVGEVRFISRLQAASAAAG